MPGETDPISQFEDRVRGWPGVWASIDMRCICFKQPDGWRNVLGSVRLLAGRRDEYEPMDLMYSDDHFAILQEVAAIATLPAVLAGLRDGRLQIGERTVLLDSPTPPDGKRSTYAFTFEPQKREWARQMNYVMSDYLTFVLQGRGRYPNEFVSQEAYERASRAMFAHRIPHGGFPDVARSLFSVTYDNELLAQPSMITIVAPSYSRFESLDQATGRNLEVRIQGPPKASPDDYRLNLIMRPLESAARRVSLPFTHDERLDKVGYLHLKKTVQLATAPLVELYLIFRDEPVDSLKLTLPSQDTTNPRFLAHLVYDEMGSKLRRFLFPDAKPTADAFEVAVGWLLYLCGFQIGSYGLPEAKLDGEIDILAFLPLAKGVMGVECTTAMLKQDKLIRLANRCQDLKGAIPGYDVLSVAVTVLDHATEPERDAARKLNISILTKVELEEILGLAQRHASAQEVFEYIRRKVPSGF